MILDLGGAGITNVDPLLDLRAKHSCLVQLTQDEVNKLSKLEFLNQLVIPKKLNVHHNSLIDSTRSVSNGK